MERVELESDEDAMWKVMKEQDAENDAALTAMEDVTADILRQGSLRLVSGFWLMQRPPGWRVQRLQDLPEEALLSPETAARLLLHPFNEDTPLVVALSYRWLTTEHPDPDGAQLAKLRKFLDPLLSFLSFESNCESQDDSSDVSHCCDVGIMWDFMSLPQKPLTEDDKSRFHEGLSVINRLYGSALNTFTLQLTATPPGITKYHASGWCLFEDAISRMIKITSLLCSLNNPSPIRRRETYYPGIAEMTDQRVDPGNEFMAGCRDLSYNEFLSFKACCGADRKPPLHPNDIAAILRSDRVKFTCGSDVDVVIDKYTSFYEEIAAKVVVLDFGATESSQGKWRTSYAPIHWSSEEMRLFSRTLADFSKCRRLMLGGHAFTKETAAILADAVVRMRALEHVDFSLPLDKPTQFFDVDAEEVLRKTLCGTSRLRVSFPYNFRD